MPGEYDARGKQLRRGERLVSRREPNGRSARKSKILDAAIKANNRKILASADNASVCAVYIACPRHERRPSKIGVSNDTMSRLEKLQVAHWVPLIMAREVWLASSSLAFLVEQQTHSAMGKRFNRLTGEWFDASVGNAEAVLFEVLGNLGIEPIDNPRDGVLNVNSSN